MAPIKEHDRLLAATVNVAAIFFPYAGPIVGAAVLGKSPYARYHALKSLIEQIVSTLVIGFLMLCSLSYSIYSLYHQMEGGFDWSKIDWVSLLIKSLVTYLLLALWELINIVLSIRDAIQAMHGKLPDRPKWAERKALALSGMNRLPASQIS